MALSRKVVTMQTSTEAEENLRIIRSLMEKATIYRAISAPAALLGGVLSVAVAAAAWWLSGLSVAGARVPFLVSWLAVLAITSGANLWLLWRDAVRRGEPFASQGMRLALRAMMPALLAGGFCTLIATDGGWPLIASLWVLLYGVSLLAASHFAPKSLCWLGRVFFLCGSLLLVLGIWVADSWRGTDQTTLAHLIMGATFGLFHLIYAACTWPRNTGGAA